MIKLYWQELYKNQSVTYRQLRFPGQCPHEIYYGLTPNNERCLLFYVDSFVNQKIIFETTLENITLSESNFEGRKCLTLQLLNISFQDIFDDLIFFFYNSVLILDSEKEAVDAFISCYNKWIEFFRSSTSGLNAEVVKGLFGELLMFEYLLDYSAYPVNDVIDAWKGPYGKAHDFELDNTIIEVKCIDPLKTMINISSEHQLDYLSHQRLFLAVYHLQCGDDNNNSTLSGLVNKIVARLRTYPGIDIGKFWATLKKAGLSADTLTQYDTYSFSLHKLQIFHASTPEFPSIRRSLLDSGIIQVKYQLFLDAIKQLEVTQVF